MISSTLTYEYIIYFLIRCYGHRIIYYIYNYIDRNRRIVEINVVLQKQKLLFEFIPVDVIDVCARLLINSKYVRLLQANYKRLF